MTATAVLSLHMQRAAAAAMRVVAARERGDLAALELAFTTIPDETLIRGLLFYAGMLRDGYAAATGMTVEQVDDIHRRILVAP